MTLQDFIKKYNGQGVDTDQAYGFQCMDLMHQYVVDCLNLPLSLFAAPTAFEAYKAANDPRFTKVANTPTGVPNPGDIIFWNTTVGGAGHVAIFVSGDNNKFTSFDQNWPTGSKCHEQAHDYNGVIGWLSPINAPSDTQKVIDDLRLQRDNNWNELLIERTKNTELTQQLQDEQTKTQGLREAFDKQTQADANLGTELLDSQHKATAYENDLAYIAQVLKLANYKRDTIVSAIEVLQKPVDEQVKPLQQHALTLQEALASFITNTKYTSLFDKLKALWKK